MPDIEKREPGHPVVEQPERGDPRQHQQPIDKVRDTGVKGKPQDRAPDRRPGKADSPWMGGG
jgi:hypothetical protein